MNNYYNSRGLPDCPKEYQRKIRISNRKVDKSTKSQIVKIRNLMKLLKISISYKFYSKKVFLIKG